MLTGIVLLSAGMQAFQVVFALMYFVLHWVRTLCCRRSLDYRLSRTPAESQLRKMAADVDFVVVADEGVGSTPYMLHTDE